MDSTNNTKEASSIGPTKTTTVTQSDVVKYHKLKWKESFGPKYKFIYDETSEYMQFVNGNMINGDEIFIEIFKLYIKSLDLGENHDIIKIMETTIEDSVKVINRLKKGSDKTDFVCRLESFVDNLNYEIE